MVQQPTCSFCPLGIHTCTMALFGLNIFVVHSSNRVLGRCPPPRATFPLGRPGWNGPPTLSLRRDLFRRVPEPPPSRTSLTPLGERRRTPRRNGGVGKGSKDKDGPSSLRLHGLRGRETPPVFTFELHPYLNGEGTGPTLDVTPGAHLSALLGV